MSEETKQPVVAVYDSIMAQRKIHLAVFTITAGMLMCYLGKITGPEWAELTKWVSIAYLGANVAEKQVTKDSSPL
jgi:hypothetical protein